MYLDFFGFKEAPFSIAPDPRYLFMSERHREALAHLIYGIRSEGGFVLLTGEVGTGKTTVCRCLLEQVPQDTEIAFVINPKLTTVELLATICDELRIPYEPGTTSIKTFIDGINARLLKNFADGRRTVLIIDEAQNLEPEVLEQIRLLTNLETNERKLLQIIMLGQPELRAKLARPELRQLAQRITARYHLEALSRPEANAYLLHRLQISGGGRPVFTSGAIRRIYRLSAGIPRRINVLCDRALLGAYVKGMEKATSRIVSQAAREAFDSPPRFAPFLRWGSALLILIAIAIFFVPSWTERRGGEAVSSHPTPVTQVSSSHPASISAAAFSSFSGHPVAESRRLAFNTLFSLWNLPPVPGDFCLAAEEAGFSCLERQDGLSSLRRFNLPAVLPLAAPEGETFFAVLSALEGNRATFRLGDAAVTIPVEELHTRWEGKYVLIWRRPPFREVLRPGISGEPAQWLSTRLGKALGVPGAAPILQGELVAQLKRFQFSRGLAPDGLVGPHTLIFLDAAVGSGVPVLDRKAEVH